MRVTAIALALFIPAAAQAATDQCRVDETVAMHDQWRRLWTEQVMTEHAFMISAVGRLDDRDMLTRRLNNIGRRMANGFERFYGNESEVALSRAFDQHITLFTRFVDAAIARDAERVARLRASLLRNADAIASIIDRAHRAEMNNEDVSPTAMRGMLREHVAISARMLQARMSEDFDTEVAIENRLMDNALEIADLMSAQIIDGFLQPNEPFCRPVRDRNR